jgi:phosphoesterase RecJ-like protein
MSETIKKFAPIILEEIKKAKNILLHCHPSPDPDSVGSSLAMRLALEGMGKKVTLIKGDSEIPKAFDFPGVNTITQKSYGEIDPKEFDLFIALDSSTEGMISFKDKPIFSETMKVVVIDHHKSNLNYGSINLVDSNYPATAMILHDLFKEIGIFINHDIALNLFMGIYGDTGGFRFPNTTPRVIRVASELAEIAPDFSKTIFTMENSNSKSKLIFEGIALSSMKEFLGGILVISTITNEELIKHNIDQGAYSGSQVANIMKSVVGYDLAVSLVEEEKGVVRAGFRTRDNQRFDVSKIAVALGGGGHAGASGARLNMTIQEAIDKVVTTAKELYNL